MDLNTLWFILISVLWIGYFVLEGFDFGVCILLPFLGKTDQDRRVMINTIGPHWDGNEVWLITAGGAIFAAFPVWYSTLFSGFYMPLFLILLALIVRGAAFEFRSKDDSPTWRSLWDWALIIGSLLPAFLWGVALVNFVRGVPINADLYYAGGFWNLLNPFALVGGLVSLSGFILHGAIFLSLKTTGFLQQRARRLALRVWAVAALALLASTVLTYFQTDIVSRLGFDPGIAPIAGLVFLLVAGWFVYKGRDGWAFTFTSLAIIFVTATVFSVLYPRVLISSLDPTWSLTIYNAASSSYTLKTMSIVALIFLPFVLAYQAWSYWTFRKRVTARDLHY